MTARTQTVAATLGAAWLLVSCGSPDAPPAAAPATAQEAAEIAVAALAAGDFAALAELVHPVRGVRFSPYATVSLERDVVLSAQELRGAESDRSQRLWGEYDGTGDPIRLTFGAYFRRFVYNAGFANSEQVASDRRLGYGNSIDNIRQVYPGATSVEYHLDGVDPEMGGMDWCSLRLVLAEHQGRWTLVGIVHDQWTT